MAGAFDEAVTTDVQRKRTASEILTDLLRAEAAYPRGPHALCAWGGVACRLDPLSDERRQATGGKGHRRLQVRGHPDQRGDGPLAACRIIPAGPFFVRKIGAISCWSAAPAREKRTWPSRLPPASCVRAHVAGTSTLSIWLRPPCATSRVKPAPSINLSINSPVGPFCAAIGGTVWTPIDTQR